MSVESMAIVLHHSRAKGTAKLILLGIANHDGDGGAWPSVNTLAKYANCSRTQVQRSLTQLEALNEVTRYVQAGGDHRHAEHERPNRYSIRLRCPADCDRSSSHRTSRETAPQLDIDPVAYPAAPTRPGTPPHPRGPAALMRPTPAALMRPKPSTQLTTHLPETKSGDRARGDCGHVLVDDRHCEMGCAISERAS
jgi:hypothetical protein